MTKSAESGVQVSFKNVGKDFGSVRALDPISLDIRSGEFLTLLGPSGSGKTTLLNIAAGFLSPDTGQVLLGERDVTHVPPRDRNIGMVFQNYALFPNLNVGENVAYGLKVRKYPKAQVESLVTKALTMVQLDGYAGRAIQQLSGGQQQRVALARAMVIQPDVLLMDEPLGALDRQLRKHVQLEIRRLHLAAPRTTISVTHDQEEAMVMSDRVAIMSHGRIEQIGTPHELYATPKNIFVAKFLGESNILPICVLGESGGQISFTIDGCEGVRFADAGNTSVKGAASLLIRPEGLQIAEEGQSGLAGRVAEVVYLGELTARRVTLDCGKELWMRSMSASPADVGDRIEVTWRNADARVLSS